MCPKAPENLKGKVNISLEERKMEDIENDLGEIFNKKPHPPTPESVFFASAN